MHGGRRGRTPTHIHICAVKVEGGIDVHASHRGAIDQGGAGQAKHDAEVGLGAPVKQRVAPQL
jgi:hypothetical protein